MNLEERKLTSEAVYDGGLLHVRYDTIELPDGNTSWREYFVHGGAVCVVPITDDGQVVLEHQYRYAVGEVMLEIPAGKLDSAEEDPLDAAKRELREETGYIAEKWTPMGYFYPAVAYCTEKIWMFAATGLTRGEQDMDEDEFLEVFTAPLSEMADKALMGEIPDIKTQAALVRANELYKRGLI